MLRDVSDIACCEMDVTGYGTVLAFLYLFVFYVGRGNRKDSALHCLCSLPCTLFWPVVWTG